MYRALFLFLGALMLVGAGCSLPSASPSTSAVIEKNVGPYKFVESKSGIEDSFVSELAQYANGSQEVLAAVNISSSELDMLEYLGDIFDDEAGDGRGFTALAFGKGEVHYQRDVDNNDRCLFVWTAGATKMVMLRGVSCSAKDALLQAYAKKYPPTVLNEFVQDIPTPKPVAPPAAPTKKPAAATQKFVSKIGGYQLELPSAWLIQNAEVANDADVYGFAGAVAGKKIEGDYSVWIRATDASSPVAAVKNVLKMQGSKVAIIDKWITDLDNTAVPAKKIMNDRGLEEDAFFVFTLIPGKRYAIVTFAELSDPDGSYEKGLTMLFRTLRPL